MKRNNLFNLSMVFVLALVFAGGVVMARQAQAQEDAPERKLSSQAAVGTGFTYQGRLLDNGAPVEGTCSFGLSLYGSPSGVDQVGTTQDKTGVPVSNGYFTVNDLDFGADAFDGSARYLEIAVDCGGGAETLDPRVVLNAAPYAHSLRPGSVVKGSSTGSILSIENDSSIGVGLVAEAGTASGKSPITGAALWGDSATVPGMVGTSNNAAGVFGWSTSNAGVGALSNSGNAVEATSVSGHGVRGEATGSTGTPYGVYGLASDAGSATSFGVYGQSNSSVGTGVGGEAPMNGIYGEATSSSGETYGVYGKSDSTSGHGVYGTNTSAGGSGVYGYSASGHGVHGKANPPDGYGVYSEGNAYVEGELFWDAKTSYVAVSTAAFIPELYGDIGHVEYNNEGYYLKNEEDTAQYFVAQAQLPHNAIVTELLVGWRDGSDSAGDVYLKRRSMMAVNDSIDTMASVTSVGSFGSIQEGVWSDDTIDNAAIDNRSYTYYLELYLPSSTEDIRLYGVVIEYTIYEPY